MKYFIPLCWFSILIIFAACGEDTSSSSNSTTPKNTNNRTNHPIPTHTGSTHGTKNHETVPTTTITKIDKPGFVPIELEDFVRTDDDASASVYQVNDASQLMHGPVALGKLDDYILENDHVKFLIESDTRNMNPCPWGGNVLDAAVKTGEAPNLDILGEVCLFMNSSFTLKPEQFEMLQIGKSAVLAVAGKLTHGDFINIKSMIADQVPLLANAIKTDTETIPSVDMTVYYILRPEDRGLRVITSSKNIGDKKVDLAPIHLVASGGDGYYFNPLSKKKGFGGPAGLSTSATPFPYLLFNGEQASYGYVPDPAPSITMKRDLPVGGAYLVFAGVAATMLRETNVLNTLLSPAQLARSKGVMHIEPGGIDSFTHWFFAGDGSLSSILDHGYKTIGTPTTKVEGKVLDGEGKPFSGARVVAVYKGATYNQTISEKDGSFYMELPQKRNYKIYARFKNRPPAKIEDVNVLTSLLKVPDLKLKKTTKIIVNISDDNGSPLPGRVSVLCVGKCKGFQNTNDADVNYHNKPSQYAAIAWAGIDGKIEVELPSQNDYRITVSRGLEWTTWPGDAAISTGIHFKLAEGETKEFHAEIMKVVETPNALSADFHIHTISSPDSTVAHEERVLGFMGAGVDVMVTTDHDIITDFAPAIQSLGASQEITSMIGEEVTTSDLGHFNVFPIVKDDTKNRRGGAIDWGNGEDLAYDPTTLFEKMNAFPGTQVVQMNHAASLGLVKSTKSDVLRGISKASRERKRLPSKAKGPNGDTGLWSDNFTAMEVMNGNSQKTFWTVAHWWFTMIGRGFVPTGTGTSDTHKRYSNLGGVPRTFVFVDGMDNAKNFKEEAFVKGVNNANAIGTNGPFFTVKATNQKSEKAGPGETLATEGKTIQVEVEIQVPEWIDVTDVDYYFNPKLRDVFVRAGKTNNNRIRPTGNIPINFSSGDIKTLQGTMATHKLKTKKVNFSITTAVDGYLIIIVRGKKNMFPVVITTPFAFSNPILIDADGNGYDHPPYMSSVNTPPPFLPQPRPGKAEKEMTIHQMNHALDSILHELVCTH